MKVPSKYLDRCERIDEGYQDDVKYIVVLKSGWTYLDEYHMYPCEDKTELYEVLDNAKFHPDCVNDECYD